MSLKFLILDTYYERFLDSFYAERPDLVAASYEQQWQALMDYCFGTADFYSFNLRKLGHEAEEVVANCTPLQQQWIRENRVRTGGLFPFQKALGIHKGWQLRVLAAQIEKLKPDILYVQDLNWTDVSFLREIQVRLIVGQTAYPLHPNLDYRSYDLILTSFPHYVEMFRNYGVRSEYLRIAFEPQVLERLGAVHPTYPVVFVGGYSAHHRSGSQILEQLANQLPLDFWGYGVEYLPHDSPIRQRYHGEAWGIEMYRILAQSQIALNRHIDIAGCFANNMRLYEATGVGTLLVTDWKDNLHELFEPGREVVTYRDVRECTGLVRYYLDHEDERTAIAKAGQERTLREHTYYHRMEELVDVVDRYLRYPERITRKVVIPAAVLKHDRLDQVVTAVRPLLKQLPGQRFLRPLWHRLRARISMGQLISYGHHVISSSAVTEALTDGWKDPSIPQKQRHLVDSELQRMHQGDIVPVYRVAAQAVRATGLEDPLIVEIGCASGYYSEVLSHLLGHPMRYMGADYSAALVQQASQYYPGLPFMVADATALPLRDNCCDILFSPALLMHVPAYEQAIRESVRLSRFWCIFHRTPVVKSVSTVYLSKRAYGVPVVEIVFNENELLALFDRLGLRVEQTFQVGQYDLPDLPEPVEIKTYACCKAAK